MDKRKILVQLDGDLLPSVFDRIVALDAGADEVFSYGNVRPEQVRDLVHGAIFTRGPKDLKRTALFIGGSDVGLGEKLLAESRRHMIPQSGLRVSVLLDANGANTTAAAAVRSAAKHLDLGGARAVVLGAGPVGHRVARLLAGLGAEVRITALEHAQADAVGAAIRARTSGARIEPMAARNADEVRKALEGRTLAVAAGPPGVLLVPKDVLLASKDLRLAIDLNAVPPLGIEGLEVMDKGIERDGVIAYGAIGVGDTKMKVHKAAIARLFESNDQVLDAEEVYALALTV
jgi:hypothetical protein